MKWGLNLNFKNSRILLKIKFEVLFFYVKLGILKNRNKNINHLKQNFNDLKIQLARKIRTDILSLYRKMSSLSAPVRKTLNIKLSDKVSNEELYESTKAKTWSEKANKRKTCWFGHLSR